MSTPAPVPDFATYLTCNLPEGYPFDPPLHAPPPTPMKESVRKQLVQRETTLFELAYQIAASHPWLSYLAALKHEAVLALTPIEATPFVDINDQKFYKDGQNNWRIMRRDVRTRIDDPTAFFCERLVLLQRETFRIDDAAIKMSAAVKSGFGALEPLPPEPLEPVRNFLGGVNKEKLEDYQAAKKAWQLHESYLNVCQAALKAVSSLPPKNRHDRLRDLPACLVALQELREERDALLVRYVTPYFG